MQPGAHLFVQVVFAFTADWFCSAHVCKPCTKRTQEKHFTGAEFTAHNQNSKKTYPKKSLIFAMNTSLRRKDWTEVYLIYIVWCYEYLLNIVKKWSSTSVVVNQVADFTLKIIY